MEICFERPYKFNLDVIDIDERTPSFQVEISIIVENFIHKCSYSGKLWIEYSEWDRFINSLKNNENKISTLKSMSNDFFYLLQGQPLPYSLSVVFQDLTY